MNKNKFIIIYTAIFITVLYFFDQIIPTSYLVKVIIKLIFIILSLILSKFYLKLDFDFLKFKSFKNYKLGILLSIFTFLIIFVGFFIVKNFINIESLRDDFLVKYQLDGIAFFIASFYLVFINSFVEEYFFRGFIYRNLDNRKFANYFSAIAFSIYHLSNFQNWFDNKLLLLLPLITLTISGLLFNYLANKSKDIYNSYIPHMFADMSIVVIGYYLIIR